MTAHIINVVWGEKYLHPLLEYSLPFHFSPGNLEGFQGKYIFYTTEGDKEIIRAHANFKKLETYLPVEFRIISITEDPYTIMNACHCDAIKQGNEEDVPIIFLFPECIFSRGLFSYLQESIDQGKRLVALCTTRLSMEKMHTKLSPYNFSSSELAVLATKNLHPFTQQSFYEEGETLKCPSQIYFNLDPNNILVRSYHLHPLLLWPRNQTILPPITTDGPHFLEKAIPNFEEWDVITNNKKVSLFELTSEMTLEKPKKKLLTPFSFYRWADVHVTAGHRFFAKHSIILGDSIENEKWDQTKQEADHLIASLEKAPLSFRIAKPFLILSFYLKKLGLILIGKKRFPLSKILSHLKYILKTRSIPFS